MTVLKKFKFHLLFIGFLFVLILLTYKDYGIIWDESTYIEIGKYYIGQLFGFLHVKVSFPIGSFTPTEIHLKGHGVLFDVLAILLTLFFQKFSLETYHLIKALMALPIFIIVAWIVLRLSNKWYSLAAMVILLLFPRFYGDIYQNSADIPAALALSMVVGYFFYFRKTDQSFFKQVILGLVSAIAISQRVILGYLALLNIFFILITDFYQKRPLKTIITKIIVIGGSTLLFLHLTQPYLLAHPIKGLLDILTATKDYQWTAAVLFEGKMVWAYELPWYYLPKSILITTPLATIGLFLTGFIYLIYLFFKEKKDINKKLSYLYLILILTVPLIVVFMFKPTLYDGWRHFLFLTIPIVLIASFGLVALGQIKHKVARFLLLAIILVNGLFTIKEMIVLHPYQYIYYNELVGGLKGAYGRYETDYWGAAFKEAIGWFNKNINKDNRIYWIITEGDSLSSTYYFKKNTFLTYDPNIADYHISFTRWQAQNKFSGRIIYTVQRESVPLIFIKKLR